MTAFPSNMATSVPVSAAPITDEVVAAPKSESVAGTG